MINLKQQPSLLKHQALAGWSVGRSVVGRLGCRLVGCLFGAVAHVCASEGLGVQVGERAS